MEADDARKIVAELIRTQQKDRLVQWLIDDRID